MADVLPFRSFRFQMNKHARGALAALVSYPYAGIDRSEWEANKEGIRVALADDAARKRLSPIERVHIHETRHYPSAPLDPPDHLYARTRQRIMTWIEDEVLTLDDAPTLYVYHQTFFSPRGVKLVRQGLIARVKLEEYDAKIILPHERTLSAPKIDRLELMQATEANLNQVFMLYDDPQHTINARLNTRIATEDSLLEITTEDGILHQLWGVRDEAFARELRAHFSDQQLLIADGHHRYETALAYRALRRARDEADALERPAAGDGQGELPPYEYIMTLLVNTHDPGLLVLPTHRVVHSIDNFSADAFLAQLDRSPFFETERLVLDSDLPLMERGMAWLRACEESGRTAPSVVLCSRHFDEPVLVRFTGSTSSAIFSFDVPEPVRALDVTILHEGILDDMLGIDREAQAAKTNLRYKKHLDEALLEMELPDTQLVVLMNATPVSHIQRVCASGGKMPQKSTYFYPKILSGLMINPL